MRRADAVIVGGGPAGAIAATRLATAGHDVVVLERAPRWRWRACGVFTSPGIWESLGAVGLREADLAAIARPIPGMSVETRRGAWFRLGYRDAQVPGSAAADRQPAAGLDRGRLDPLLLGRARDAGAEVREGVAVAGVDLGAPRDLRVRTATGEAIEARIVVGADGARSMVARAAGVARRSSLGPRVGLTFHVVDPELGEHDARMVVIEDGYVGLAPVPGRRINVGIVLGPSWFAGLRIDGAEAVVLRIARRLLGDGVRPLDRIAGASPLGAGVHRRAGAGWLLVGDAAGFLDPFTGEGLHRAIASAELAAAAIDDALRARSATEASDALARYERAMRARFREKDVVTRIVHEFLGRPALFEYAARRLAGRDELRQTMAAVIGDLAPARRALDPRYLGALLRP